MPTNQSISVIQIDGEENNLDSSIVHDNKLDYIRSSEGQKDQLFTFADDIDYTNNS